MATTGIVKGIVSNLVTVEVDGPVSQNEICYISVGGVKLMAEVIKVIGKNAFVQVFESTRGMRVGDEAEFEGHMLEVTLGPGMLSRNYDGLQNDLDKMEGVFLRRGEYTFPLDNDKLWDFKPLAKVGDKVAAGGWLGEVDENFQPHKRIYGQEPERSRTIYNRRGDSRLDGRNRQRCGGDDDTTLAGKTCHHLLQRKTTSL